MRTCLLLFTFIVIHLSQAQKVAYFPGFELINMERAQGLQYSTSKLIKSYIEDNHNYTVVLDADVGRSYVERQPLGIIAEKADQAGIRYVMKGEIHYLQGTYIISLGVYESENMEQVWHDMAKGAAESDLDPLLSRLGRSFMTNRTAKTDIQIDEVTEYDQKGVELMQIKVNHYAGLLLGGKSLSNEGVLSGFGITYTYDASTVLFNLDFEFYPTSNIVFDHPKPDRRIQNGTISLGVTYPLNRKRITPFVYGGMEYGYTKITDELFDIEYSNAETGIGAYVGGGLLINRNSTVNLRLYGALSVPFYEVNGTNLTAVKFGIITSFARKRR